MQLEWDETKRRSNIVKHGLDFTDAALVLEGYTLTFRDKRHDERYLSLGLLRTNVIVIVHTPCPSTTRIISMRKATKNETKIFYKTI